MTALPTGLVTFVLTDVEGSTRAWEREPDAMADAVRRLYEVVDAVVAAHGGVRPQEQGEGDSTVCAFTSPVAALEAAASLQSAILDERWPTEDPIRVRAAVHTGEVRLRDDRNYMGPVLNRTARLRAAAHGGQVLVSGTVHAVVGDRVPSGLALVPLGRHRLRDLGMAEDVFQLSGRGLPATFPPIRTLATTANNLPVQMSTLVGRDAEVAAVRRLLETERCVTLTGDGGIGKTRLSLQVAAEVSDRFADGVWFVELAPATDELVAQAVAEVLRVPSDGYEPADATVRALRDRAALLVLDNCEHVLDAVADLVSRILRDCAATSVLVTSREPLDIAGEHRWPVPALAVPADAGGPQTEVADTEAVRLFADRAVRVRPDLDLGETTMRAVAEICRRLDGIPLAIELAAAQVSSLSPVQIAQALDDRFALLARGGRGARGGVPHHRTLLDSVEWSHQLLADDERVVLRRLAAFPASWSLDAATTVAGAAPITGRDVRRLLGRLVDKSLVVAEDARDEVRYRMLETVRAYARDRLVDAGEEEAITARLAGWAAASAAAAAPEIERARQLPVLDSLEADHESLRVALDHLAAGDPPVFVTMAADLAPFWALRGHVADGRRWLRRALGVDVAPVAERARAAWGLSYVLNAAGIHDEAVRVAAQALVLAEEAGAPRVEARALSMLATLNLRTDPPAHRRMLERAVEQATAAGDEWCVADSLLGLGHSFAVQEDHDSARLPLAAAGRHATSLGNGFLLAWVRAAEAWGAWRWGDFASARTAAAELLALGRRLNELGAQAYGVRWSVLTEVATGEPGPGGDALVPMLDDLVRAEATGLARILTVTRWHAQLLGGAVDDIPPLDEQEAGEQGSSINAYALWVHAEASLARSEIERVLAAVESLEFTASRLDSRSWAATADDLLARVALARGDVGRAVSLARRALAARAALRERPGAIDAMETLTAALGASGELESATVALAAARAARTKLSYVASPPATRAALRAAEPSLAASLLRPWRDRGRALSLDAAVAELTAVGSSAR